MKLFNLHGDTKQREETAGLQDEDDIERIKLRYSRRKKRITELKILGLGEQQLFPPRALLQPEHLLLQKTPLINRDTPVGSMGSCFAREIKKYLVRKEFNYVQYGEGRDVEHGSARWNRVYNTGCIRQEIGRAFGEFEPELLPAEDGSVIDPHRKGVRFESREQAAAELESYKSEARSALLDSRVFVITLGLSEVWQNKNSGAFYAEAPPLDVFDAERDVFRLIPPEENSANLRSAVTLLKANNPGVDIIVTVSPVPLRATFMPRSALVSNNVSKAALIWAAHEITEELEYVHYFPSYEIVQYLAERPFEWDFRHVRTETVERIMAIFHDYFVC